MYAHDQIQRPASVRHRLCSTVKETAKHHPKGVSAAYADIGATLAEYSFRWVQGN